MILFESDASNLVTPDTNGDDDILRRNRKAKKTTRVSVNNAGAQGNAAGGDGSEDPDVSENGRWFVWEDDSTNLKPVTNGEDDIFWRNLRSKITKLVSKQTDGTPSNDDNGNPKVSYNGRFVAYHSDATNLVAGDSNKEQDIFVSGPMR